MTNTIAVWLGLCLIAFFALDYFVLHLDAARFTVRLLLDLIGKMAFWR